MGSLKTVSWNIEHMGKLLGAGSSDRRRAVAHLIKEVRPDVLCIVEGTPNILHLREFVSRDLGGEWEIVERDGTDEALAKEPGDPHKALAKLYGMSSHKTYGTQWIWFLVRRGLSLHPRMVPVAEWKTATEPYRDNPKPKDDGSWTVNFWGDCCPHHHKHYRWPQVLSVSVGGQTVELVGVHFKSKFNRNTKLIKNPYIPGTKMLGCRFRDEAIKARIKLATEAQDVRRFVSARFDAAEAAGAPEPNVVVMGDLNDGVGKEFFEREYLFFDLLSTLQGDVFFARRFLNHALFDSNDENRWTYFLKGEDPIDPGRNPKILLDHILFTQGFTAGSSGLRIEAGAGRVEHDVYEEIPPCEVFPADLPDDLADLLLLVAEVLQFFL